MENCLSLGEAGGLDFKPTRIINSSLLLHLSWKLINDDTQCALMFRKCFLAYGRPILHHFKSSVWLGVREHISTVNANSLWLIGDGAHINFWMDNSLGTPLATIFNILHSRHLTSTLSDFIIDGKLQLPGCFLMNPLLEASVQNIVIHVTPILDQRVWPLSKDGELTSKFAFLFLHGMWPSLV